MRKLMLFTLFLIIAALGCSRYNYTVSPVKLPSKSNNMVVFNNGIKVSANVITEDKEAGFNIEKAKVLPVRITVNNESKDSAIIAGSQCFLIDNEDNAWPILSYDRAVERIKENVIVGESLSGAKTPAILGGLLGAVGGLAIGILTDKDIAESAGKGAAVGAAAGAVAGGIQGYSDTEKKISDDLAEQHIRDKQILPNMITYGFLYFPGEAKSVKELRLAIEVNGKLEVKTLKFQ
jgi:uncharacterized protein YcfJ